MASILFYKIFGALTGSAVGDALGGPVEGWSSREIEKKHKKVEVFLPYTKEPSYHGPFKTDAGAYTDDTRLMKILCEACVEAGGPPKRGDIKRIITERFYSSNSVLERGFLEEYAMKALYENEKEAFGGQPTNGGLMAIAPLGVIVPCNPVRAYALAFETLYFCTGYARSATALSAAMVSAAMIPGISIEEIVDYALHASKMHKKNLEGSLWTSWDMYKEVALKSETLLEKAVEIAGRYKNTDTLKDELSATVTQDFFADAAETLAVGAAMFTASEGDFREAVLGAVNYGRDNDSSASFAGALSGAWQGSEVIDRNWIDKVESVNPSPTLYNLATHLTDIVKGMLTKEIRRTELYQSLLL